MALCALLSPVSGYDLVLICHGDHSYEASAQGYDRNEKTRELFEKPSRFILLHLLDSNTVETKPLALIAFSMFRFDNEKNAEGKLREVVYWWVRSAADPISVLYMLTDLSVLVFKL